jgi:sporulation protein YlmC with PRC-barrel domain
MQLNSVQFPDNSRVETYSQTQRQMIVNQSPASLAANHVVGSTGQPFVQLSQNSMTIQTNGATDLVAAQIELPINAQTMQQMNIAPENTFVAMMSQDRQAWIVMEGIKAVNTYVLLDPGLAVSI